MELLYLSSNVSLLIICCVVQVIQPWLPVVRVVVGAPLYKGTFQSELAVGHLTSPGAVHPLLSCSYFQSFSLCIYCGYYVLE